MRKIRIRPAAAFLIISTFAAACCVAQTTAPSPVLKTDKLQEPPMQRAEWTPPQTDLPADLISATTRLFQQGLADPRGCEYREIGVRAGDRDNGDAGVLACHGWVLPDAGNGAQRFAVCWNGLVYRVEWIKEKANLTDDVQTAIRRSDDLQRQFGSECCHGGAQSTWNCDSMPSECSDISEKYMLPMHVCLLLRLDETDLTEKFWALWQAKDTEKHNRYELLAVALEWSMYNCAVNAHHRDDPRLSLIYARTVVLLDKAAIKQFVADKTQYNYLSSLQRYLWVIPVLIEDDQRRIDEKPHARIDKKGESAYPDKKAWINALIADMDQIDEASVDHGWSTCAGPVVKSLRDCGEDAVDPLLDCLERDTRLTRAGRPPISVQSTAEGLLMIILQTDSFGDPPQNGKVPTPAEAHAQLVQLARDYWRKAKGTTPQQRWMQVLNDDGGDYYKWTEVIEKLTRWIGETRNSPPVDQAAVEKQTSALFDAVAKRVDKLDQKDAQTDAHCEYVGYASWMVLQLARWDKERAKPLLKQQLEFAADIRSSPLNGIGAESVPDMAMMLAEMGDHSGLNAYGQWLVAGTGGKESGWEPQRIFLPLWYYQDDPSMAETAETLFGGAHSDWNPVIPEFAGQLFSTPLLGFKKIRDQVQRGLADQTEYGTATIRENNKLELVDKFGNPKDGEDQIPFGATHVAPIGTAMKIRMCDRYAHDISAICGAPELRFYWSETDRDSAVKACLAFLDRYPERLKFQRSFGPSGNPDQAKITFPLLDHPASNTEAQSLAAIFSLEGQGERRLLKRSLPAHAHWIALRKYPFDWEVMYPDRTEKGHSFDDDCEIWQAEEVKVNGKWQRFFGVVSPHEICKVPAEEIEFDVPGYDDPLKGRLSSGVDCHFGVGIWLANSQNRLVDANPLNLWLHLHNRFGTPVEVPSQILVKLADGKVAIRPGILMMLKRLGDAGSTQADRDPKLETPVQAKPTQSLSADLLSKRQTLESDVTLKDIQFDVRDYFVITQPGRYRLQIRFTKESGVGEGESPAVEFELK